MIDEFLRMRISPNLTLKIFKDCLITLVLKDLNKLWSRVRKKHTFLFSSEAFFLFFFAKSLNRQKDEAIFCLFNPPIMCLFLLQIMIFGMKHDCSLYSSNYVWTINVSGTNCLGDLRMQHAMILANSDMTSFKTGIRPPTIKNIMMTM